MKKRICAFFLAGAMAMGLFGCGEAPQGAAPAWGPGVITGERGAFLTSQQDLYDPALVPSAAAYAVAEDFSNVINYGDWERVFTDEAKQLLAQNGFVVLEDGMEEFFSLYENNRYSLTPNFVTTDAMMHTYHLFFSRLLKNVEREHFCADLAAVSAVMRDESLTQAEALKGTGWENAALRNAAFFSVGLALQQPDAEIPAKVRDAVQRELDLIGKAEGIDVSPVMNLGGGTEIEEMEDYSQYIPRGYYTTAEELGRYFKAMMWYGRLTFRQSDEDQSRSALLMTLALAGSGAWEKWEKIYTVTSFFVGDSDDAGVYEYAPLIEEAYGGWPQVKDLPQNGDAWEAFRQAAEKLDPPAINSIPIFDEDIQPDQEEAIAGFRFLGQRFTLDASVFQQLVYRQVRPNPAGERRMLPSALDFPTALGSAEAEKLLTAAGAMEYEGYGANLAKLQDYLSDPPQQLWTASLYGGWLNTLRPLLAEKGAGWPQFMRNEAWTRKNLNSFLGSWTELKHDTVLYAKQVYAEMGGGPMEEKDDRGYVEPEPVLYSRLAGLARATADGLAQYGVLRDADADNLERMTELARQLTVISEKELRDELLSDEEYDLILSFGGQLEHFWYDALADEASDGVITSADHPAAVITDVATDPDGGRVLEVGTGQVNSIFVIVSVDGVLRLARGGVFSFYEFAQPLDQRLTDEKWRKMLGIDRFDENGNFVDESVDVPLPEWTASFLTASDRGW